jgi:hypothetical protein
MDALKMATIINEVKAGVSRSAFGDLFVFPDPHDFTKKEVNQLAMIVFNSILPQMIAEELVKERIANDKRDLGAG